jgi:hypothetical protein
MQKLGNSSQQSPEPEKKTSNYDVSGSPGRKDSMISVNANSKKQFNVNLASLYQ